MTTTPIPPVVSEEEWRQARAALLAEEKRHTRELDALAARRRLLPVTLVEKEYVFAGPSGARTLLDLFDGRRQLITYHFMPLHDDGRPCPGCSKFTDNVGSLAHLRARDVNYVCTTPTPLEEISRVVREMGWTAPFYSEAGNGFANDFGAGEGFGVSVFLRDGSTVYRSYFTTGRGADRLMLDQNLLDLVPYGRQEEWEDSPPGWPQTPPYWWRRHDEYDQG